MYRWNQIITGAQEMDYSPEAKKRSLISGVELMATKAVADEDVYRITTVNIDPLSDFEESTIELDKITLDAVEISSITGYKNIYEMPLWEFVIEFAPWLLKHCRYEKVVAIEKIGQRCDSDDAVIQ
jgi:hypothetical protein